MSKPLRVGGQAFNTSDPRAIRLLLNELIRRLFEDDPNKKITPEEARTVKQICDSQLQCLDRERQNDLEKRLEQLEQELNVDGEVGA